jgi:hypothetical protein
MDAIAQCISNAQRRRFSLNKFHSRASKEENRESICVRTRWRTAINRKMTPAAFANCQPGALR